MLAQVSSQSVSTQDVLNSLRDFLKATSTYIKTYPTEVCVKRSAREKFLDGVCDQQVTGTGLAHMLDMDVVGGLAEVNRSNYSKFDDDGKPIFNEQGKIMKGPNYTKPDLTPFV